VRTPPRGRLRLNPDIALDHLEYEACGTQFPCDGRCERFTTGNDVSVRSDAFLPPRQREFAPGVRGRLGILGGPQIYRVQRSRDGGSAKRDRDIK